MNEDELQDILAAPIRPRVDETPGGCAEEREPHDLPPGDRASTADDEDEEEQERLSLRSILGGDILVGGWLRKQIGLIVLLTILAILYISNSYSSKQNILEINRLQNRLSEVRFDALTRSSEVTEKCRPSYILSVLKQRNDTLLRISNEKPFVIKKAKK